MVLALGGEVDAARHQELGVVGHGRVGEVETMEELEGRSLESEKSVN